MLGPPQLADVPGELGSAFDEVREVGVGQLDPPLLCLPLRDGDVVTGDPVADASRTRVQEEPHAVERQSSGIARGVVHELDADAVGILDEGGVVAVGVPRVLLRVSDGRPSGIERHCMQAIHLIARGHGERDVLPADPAVAVRAGVLIPCVQDDLCLVAVVP